MTEECYKETCSNCGETSIHQFKTEVFDRREDDEPYHVTINGYDFSEFGKIELDVKKKMERRSITIDNSLSNCPSYRRSGVNIYFWCENCSGITIMSIYQEKGETFIKKRCIKEDTDKK